LLAIKGFPGRDRVKVGELAERLQLRHHSAVGLIDRLVAEELAARVRSEEDRRPVFVELTRQGERARAAFRRPQPPTASHRPGNEPATGAARWTRTIGNEGEPGMILDFAGLIYISHNVCYI
jgi:DNA-binding MarR family transcriptional regulator